MKLAQAIESLFIDYLEISKHVVIANINKADEQEINTLISRQFEYWNYIKERLKLIDGMEQKK